MSKPISLWLRTPSGQASTNDALLTYLEPLRRDGTPFGPGFNICLPDQEPTDPTGGYQIWLLPVDTWQSAAELDRDERARASAEDPTLVQVGVILGHGTQDTSELGSPHGFHRLTGLEGLLTFLREELEAPLPSTAWRSDTNPSPLRGVSRRTLRKVALRCMSEIHLRSFLFDESISPGHIGGYSLAERLLDVLHLMDGRDRLEVLAFWLTYECPECVKAALNDLESAPPAG